VLKKFIDIKIAGCQFGPDAVVWLKLLFRGSWEKCHGGCKKTAAIRRKYKKALKKFTNLLKHIS